ncbi:heavy metal-associated isoprenylated plant protein 3-like [Malania oleifera]|uniref:heavy metal-associated isoprenylated plant protein 3-like n=1 Tax=Malania oleifera TaxID=397392 RepID=UPI0025AEA7C3|nr:heavy metal-associated isoprenylated plant protein 3-like [Malania oleifera]
MDPGGGSVYAGGSDGAEPSSAAKIVSDVVLYSVAQQVMAEFARSSKEQGVLADSYLVSRMEPKDNDLESGSEETASDESPSVPRGLNRKGCYLLRPPIVVLLQKEAGKGEGKKKADAGEDSGKGAGEGCPKKVKRFVKNNIEGVVDVKADCKSNKLTVVRKVDPTKVQEKVAEKTKKKVELLSPPPKKDAGSGGDKKPEEKKAKADDKKPKKPPVSTVFLKIKLHCGGCDGCIRKIKKGISKVEGVQEVTVEPQKDLVMVKGTMDVKSLTPYLSDKLRGNVDVVPPKKGGGGDKKDKGGGYKKYQKKGGGFDKMKKAYKFMKFKFHVIVPPVMLHVEFSGCLVDK